MFPTQKNCLIFSEREVPASADYGSSQPQNGAYVADRPNYGVETPQNYYQVFYKSLYEYIHRNCFKDRLPALL